MNAELESFGGETITIGPLKGGASKTPINPLDMPLPDKAELVEIDIGGRGSGSGSGAAFRHNGGGDAV